MDVDADRNMEELPKSPDPRSDLLIYRPPPAVPTPGDLPDEDMELFMHAMPAGEAIYYLYYPSGSVDEVLIEQFKSRLEAAAFILGKEDMQLSRLNETDRQRIRSQFPEFF